MDNHARFKYYLDAEGLDRPEPIFHLWIESAKGFSDVSGETVLAAGKALPLFPDYATWRQMIMSKKRCGRCWHYVRGHNDLIRHMEIHHTNAPIYMPAGEVARRVMPIVLICLMVAMTSCQQLNRLLGKDNHKNPANVTGVWHGQMNLDGTDTTTQFFLFQDGNKIQGQHNNVLPGASNEPFFSIDYGHYGNVFVAGSIDGDSFSVSGSNGSSCPNNWTFSGEVHGDSMLLHIHTLGNDVPGTVCYPKPIDQTIALTR